ncbi:MAG TPA: ABC transporter permease [Flavisolibacter sp.]|jgi:ABC-type transport system involved in multi-copper enzyme maturation permease subunit|nr:ABC transporter permease [Flavisolibacter sp.]
MLHLLKIEWLKIKNYRAFWVFTILYLASIFLVNYIFWNIQQQTFERNPGAEQIFGNPFAFPKVWQTVGWTSSWLLYFPGMLMIMLMTNEFNFKTHRQNIIDGLSRHQFITVKMVMILLLAVVITLINFATGLTFGSITNSAFSTTGMEYLAYIFLQSIAYIFFALLLAVLFRRSGLAIIVFILFGLIFEWLITAIFTFQLNMAPYAYFLPLQTSDVLIPFPFGKEVIYKNAPSALSLVIAIILYISAYLYFTRKKFVTDDL